MEKTPELVVDRKFVIVMIIVCLALGGSFTFIYLDLKADFTALKDNYANLLDQMQQLQSLIESLHHYEVTNLTAVQIYNRTKYSVVLIACTLGNGSGVEGSGFVYHAGGYIVTNNHVVEGAISISVTFFNGTVAQAQLVGSDVYSDLAVIRVNSLPEQSYPLLVGNSTQLMVGEPVYAIGNPFGLSSSMTAGIVSQTGRILRLEDFGVPPPQGNYALVDVVQFDAAVNPGNSGGPLLNSLGEVVGITFAIETTGGISAFIGIGYAIPSVIVKRVADSIIATGSYLHPWIGIEYNSSYIGGLLISKVLPDSPAESVDLQKDDIIVKVDELTINQPEELVIYLERYKSPEDVISLEVVRNNDFLHPIPKELTLGTRP